MNHLQISSKRLIDSAFWIYVFTAVVSDHTIIGNIGYVLFVGLTAFQMLQRKKLPLVPYIGLEILFIVFCFFHTFLGYAVNRSVAYDRLITLVLCMIFDWCFYYYLTHYKDWKKAVKNYTDAALIGILLSLIINFRVAINGRFGSNEAAGISLLGIRIGNMNATMIGYISMICILFVSLLYDNKSDRKKMMIYDAAFIMFIILSSTRKVLIVIPLIIISARYFKEKSNRLLKFGKAFLIIVVAYLVGYYAVFHIPSLYRAVGSRIQTLFIYLSEGNIVDSSLGSRLRLRILARDSFAAKPWMGWGLDNFKYTLNNGGYYAHSNFYEILVSVGIIGGIVYYSKYLYTIINSVRTIKRSDSYLLPVIKTCLLFIIITIVLEYWQVTYFYRLLMMPYVFLNAISTIGRQRNVNSKS